MASKRIACGTAITPAPVITRCSYSISSVIWNAARCVPAMSTAPTTTARQSRPLDCAFAFLDPLLARPALVVESNDALGLAAHVRHDEADTRIKLSRVPFDLGDHPARLRPFAANAVRLQLHTL